MPSLRELQQQLAAAVYADGETESAWIDPGRFGVARHVQVYRHNTRHSLADALVSVYPVVQRLVGAGFFAYVADDYIRRHPPQEAALHRFGHAFAGFVAAFPPAQGLSYLADVARLEWAWHEAYHEADAAPRALELLAAVAPADYARLRFRTHPALRLLCSPYPVLRIWQTNQDGAASDALVDLAQGGDCLLVLRPELTVEIETLAPADHRFLEVCAQGSTLEAACEAALARDPGYDLGARLGYWIQRRALVDCLPPSA